MVIDKLKQAASSFGVDLDKIDLQEVITDQFIKNNTTLNSVAQFLEKSGFDISNVIDLKNIDQLQLDELVKNISSFDGWKEFIMQAAKDKLGDQFGDKLGGLGSQLGGFLKK